MKYMKYSNRTEYHSEPVQEIMGSIPACIIRWGAVLVLIFYVGIIWGSYIISYPDKITVPISMTATDEEVIGQMFVPSVGFGKVSLDQEVIVRLDCYPYMEFGSVEGKIKKINTSPKRNRAEQFVYQVEVSFPNGMISNCGRDIQPFDEMSGMADIITNDRKLIDRFVDPIRQIIKQ